MKPRSVYVTLGLLAAACAWLAVPVAAQMLPDAAATAASTPPPETPAAWEEARHALVRLPLAAVLAAVLALRPRRRGTPPRDPR